MYDVKAFRIKQFAMAESRSARVVKDNRIAAGSLGVKRALLCLSRFLETIRALGALQRMWAFQPIVSTERRFSDGVRRGMLGNPLKWQPFRQHWRF
jgi:hypothetical protein